MARPPRADPILLALARLEPPLSWLDWYHWRIDRVWVCQWRTTVQTDSYRIPAALGAELRHVGFIEPVELDWNRDRYVLTPAGLWHVIHHGRPERRQARLEREARWRQRGFSDVKPIRSYTPPSEWRRLKEL